MPFWHHEHARIVSPINEPKKNWMHQIMWLPPTKEWYSDYIYGLRKNGILITDTKKNGIPQINIHESMYFGGMKYGLIKALTIYNPEYIDTWKALWRTL